MNKNLVILITTIWFCISNCKAQNSLEIARHFRHIVKLIKENKISELARLINFPLKRENPLPNIYSVNQFIRYSPILLDSSFKNKLSNYNDSDIFEHNGLFGLVGGPFRGDIWINEDGKIETINYKSEAELKLQKRLTNEIQKKIHPSVKPWERNILVCETSKYLIRIDLIENDSLRYVAWSKPKKINDRPDIILLNGIQEFQGTMGGITYTFRNNEYIYQIAEVDMAESDDEIGLFFRIYKNEKDLNNYKPLVSYKCRELK